MIEKVVMDETRKKSRKKDEGGRYYEKEVREIVSENEVVEDE